MFHNHTVLSRGNIMLTLAVVALAAIAFTLAFMVWEYSRQNTVLHDYIERLEQSREEMRLKIAAAERVQNNVEADKPKRRQAEREHYTRIVRPPGSRQFLTMESYEPMPTPESPKRVTKQTILGSSAKRSKKPTKAPRAFISSDISEWIRFVPADAILRCIEKHTRGGGRNTYVQDNSNKGGYNFRFMYNNREYRSSPFKTYREAAAFRDLVFAAFMNEDANAKA